MDDESGAAAASPAAANRAGRSSASSSVIGFQGIRRQSTTERISEILETARERADRSAMSRSASGYSPLTRSPRNQSAVVVAGGTGIVAGVLPGLGADGIHDDEGQDDDDDAGGRGHGGQGTDGTTRRPPPPPPPDETTGIMMRGPGTTGGGASQMNYQSTMNDGVRPRRRDRFSGRNVAEAAVVRRRMRSGPTQGDGSLDEAAGPGAPDSGRRWYVRMVEPFRSIELENKGSVARDHLAIERTFLAWLRTSLAFASIGIAVTQLFRLNTSLQDTAPAGSDRNGDDNGDGGGGGGQSPSNPRLRTLRQLGKPLGATFLGISILMLFLGYHRYTQAQHWVMNGKFPASRGTILLVSFVTFTVTVASLVVVVAVHPTEREL